MPTISGLRRRGFPAEGIREFAAMVGVARADSVIEYGAARIRRARRAQSDVAAPLRRARPHPRRDRELPRRAGRGGRGRQQSGGPGRRHAQGPVLARAGDRARGLHGGAAAQVLPAGARPRGSACARRYFITCREVVKDAAGNVVELRCTYDPQTRGGDSPDGRRPKATLHWLSAAHAVSAEVRLYDHLFSNPNPGAGGADLFADLNPNSETVLDSALVEASMAEVAPRALPTSSSGSVTSRPTPTPRRASLSSTER